MTEQGAEEERAVKGDLDSSPGKAVAALDPEKTRKQTLKHGHKDLLTTDAESKMETVTTQRAAFAPPKPPGVRLRGIRGELLDKHIAQMIREKILAEQSPPTPKTDFSSTTQRDFDAQGFVPLTHELPLACDYKNDQTITFWSENYQRTQGVTAVQTLNAPFRRSAKFSTPIGERLDEVDPPV